MRGTVKFFDKQKGWGFLTRDSDGINYFFHHTNIIMDGFRGLDTNDIVDFEVTMESGDAQRIQAINVIPILTMKKLGEALRKKKLYLQPMKDAMGNKVYTVVDANNVIQAGENGISLIEVAAYAGFDVEDLLNEKKEDSKMSKNFKENYVETVGEVTKYAEDYISERYDEACDNLKNLTEDNKKMLKSCNIEIDDTTDLPSVLASIKEQWNDYGCIQKAMISEMIAGVRGVDTLKTYMYAGFDTEELN